eukprot:TRINITY_DN961_c0_g1_i2.p1 TRINITY_DN961_c0_g1~~TRINITY_DN961_c0_g1_i2.p1  ORF type:complete len:934 (+),score=172.52 TRINITY_DN961_c0_g1_i2:1736-4537(+)
MHLKHSHHISSLDCLQLRGVSSQNIFLHRELNTVRLCGIDGLMMPYYENQQMILEYITRLREEKGTKFLKNLVGFGHLSINGAYQHSKSEKRQVGSLCHTDFDELKQTFSGHFHVPQKLGDHFRYVGAPLQFNFGDAGEDRGIAIYHVDENKYEWILNPHCHAFKIIDENQIMTFKQENVKEYKDTFVMIQYSSAIGALDYEKHKKDLINMGALGVKQKSLFKNSIMSAKVSVEPVSFEHTIEKYVKDVRISSLKNLIKKKDSLLKVLEDSLLCEKLTEFGKKVVRTVNEIGSEHNSKEGPNFLASIDNLKMINFMGIQNEMIIPFRELEDGIWLIEGNNGSGKSTILEALSWCQFGEFIRSDMNKDYIINDKADEAEVTIEFENGFSITRSRRRSKPDILRMFQIDQNTGEKIELVEYHKGELKSTQEKLLEILGIDFSTFSKSVILGQNVANNFITGGKEERRTIIEEALGLEKFDLYFDFTKKSRLHTEQELSRERDSIAIRESSIGDIEEERNRSDSESLGLRKTELEGKRKNIEDKFEGEFKEIDKKEVHVSSQLEELIESEPLEEHNYEYSNAVLSKAKKELVDIQSVYNTMKHEQACDTCGQSIKNPEQLLATMKDKGSFFVELMNSNGDLFANFSSFNPELWRFNDDETENQLDEANEKLNQRFSLIHLEMKSYSVTKSTIGKLQMDLLSLDNQRMRLKNNKQILLSEIETELASISSLLLKQSELNRAASDRIADYQREIDKSKERLPLLELDYEFNRFWETAFDKKLKAGMGFSPLRSFIMEDAVHSLNKICSKYMQNLSNKDSLTVTFSSNLEMQENYGKRSGGERRRTDLVALFALFELVKQHSRYQTEFMILDEIFDALDQEGIYAVQSTLQILSKKVGKVFIITHSPSIKEIEINGKIRFEMKKDELNKPLGSSFNIIR